MGGMNAFTGPLPDPLPAWLLDVLPGAGPLPAAVLIIAAAGSIVTVRRLAMRLAPGPMPVATEVVALPSVAGQDAEAA